MVKKVVLLAVVLCGLGAGLAVRSALPVLFPPDRAEVAIDLFETYCVPFVRGETVEAKGLDAYTGPFDAPNYADPITLLSLKRDDMHCTISDVLSPLSVQERERLQALTTERVAEWFPELTEDTNTGLDTWAVFKLWTNGPVDDPAYWGINLSRFADEGDSNETMLSVMKRAE